jgi:hypothetical protein
VAQTRHFLRRDQAKREAKIGGVARGGPTPLIAKGALEHVEIIESEIRRLPKGAKNAPILRTRTPYDADALTTHSESAHLGPSLQGVAS